MGVSDGADNFICAYAGFLWPVRELEFYAPAIPRLLVRFCSSRLPIYNAAILTGHLNCRACVTAFGDALEY